MCLSFLYLENSSYSTFCLCMTDCPSCVIPSLRPPASELCNFSGNFTGMRNSLPYLSGTSCLSSHLLQIADCMSWRLEGVLQCSLLHGFLRIQALVWECPILGLAHREFFSVIRGLSIILAAASVHSCQLRGIPFFSRRPLLQRLLFSKLGRWPLCRVGCEFPLAF